MSFQAISNDSPEKQNTSKNYGGYVVLSKNYIRSCHDSNKSVSDNSSLPDNAVEALRLDASYRLREITYLSTQFMRHAGRSRMSHRDVTRALHWYNAPPVLGHSTSSSNSNNNDVVSRKGVTTRSDASDLYQMTCQQNNQRQYLDGGSAADIESAVSLFTLLSSRWLMVEGRTPSSSSSSSSVTASESRCAEVTLTPAEMTYYEVISRSLLGTNMELVQMVLHDLATSPRLGSVLPPLLRCVLQAMRRLAARPYWLHRLLLVLQALGSNTRLNLGSRPNLNHMASALMFCVVEGQYKVARSSVDVMTVKQLAACLLAQLVHKWSTPVNLLPEQICQTLCETVRDRRKTLRQQCGAIGAFMMLGPHMVAKHLCPLLDGYVCALEQVLATNQLDTDTRIDAMCVQHVLAATISRLLQYIATEYTYRMRACSSTKGAPSPAALSNSLSPFALYCLWSQLCSQIYPAPLPRHLSDMVPVPAAGALNSRGLVGAARPRSTNTLLILTRLWPAGTRCNSLRRCLRTIPCTTGATYRNINTLFSDYQRPTAHWHRTKPIVRFVFDGAVNLPVSNRQQRQPTFPVRSSTGGVVTPRRVLVGRMFQRSLLDVRRAMSTGDLTVIL